MKQQYPDRHIDFCVQQKSLTNAIEVAAKAIDDQNKIHSHQRRIGKEKLTFFADQLKQKEAEIKKAKNFDELLCAVVGVER